MKAQMKKIERVVAVHSTWTQIKSEIRAAYKRMTCKNGRITLENTEEGFLAYKIGGDTVLVFEDNFTAYINPAFVSSETAAKLRI